MKTSNLIIWLLLDTRSFGGIETHVAELASGLNDYPIDIKVVFLKDYGDHPLKAQLSEMNVTYEHLNGGIKSLAKKIQSEKPNVIHTHGYKAGIFGRIVGYFYDTSVISSFHAGETPGGKLRFYDWLDRYTAFLANRVVSVSNKVSQKLPCQSDTFNNFVNTQLFKYSKGSQIAFVGRLSKEKGIDYFIQLARQFSNHTFHIYGDGPLLSNVMADAPSNTVFHGQKDTMNEVWPDIELLIITSRYEGLPMAALEAMGRGIPIISSDVGGMSKLIEHDINGWLYPNGNISTLSHLLSNWISMLPKQKNTIKTNAVHKVQSEFSSTQVIPDFIDMYQKITIKKR